MAHVSTSNAMRIIPLIGQPGAGYETLIDQLKKRGVTAEKRDPMGSRFDSQREELWLYDPTYVWNKALQASEKLSQPVVWSFGGTNAQSILSLVWPKVIVLRDPDFDELVKRRKSFRKDHDIPDPTDYELQTWKIESARLKSYTDFLLALRGTLPILELDANLTPDALADSIATFVQSGKDIPIDKRPDSPTYRPTAFKTSL